ncbi:RNI-like protein [Xylaria sp. CBS 124048]|nr:RNI-like protein [Xylaria sp. CBS 124048]
MEHVLDVSWMTHGKDLLHRTGHHGHGPPASTETLDPATPAQANGKPTSPASAAPAPSLSLASASAPNPFFPQSTPAKPIPLRGAKTRRGSSDASSGTNGTPPHRRGSWFSNISSKFSSSPSNSQNHVASPTAKPATDADDFTPLPKITPSKNAVLPHGARQAGDAPYIPAPPKNSQPGILSVLRRLSSSNTAVTPSTRASHGLVPRMILNVDQNRERCRMQELSQTKLRRVAFCVDVEIAPMPRYDDEDPSPRSTTDRNERVKTSEKSEKSAMQAPKAVEGQEEQPSVSAETLSKASEKEITVTTNGQKEHSPPQPPEEVKSGKETSRKKEKKKKSEAERKAKKEQRKKEALEKGAIPMEIHLDSDSSADDNSIQTQLPQRGAAPVINPGRIYRRCCQLRETDILTKITTQLPKTTEGCTDGIIDKLDLSGYYLPLTDLVTLGDFLAVVPIREVYLGNCGITDEGIRVILAGLLAARRPKVKYRRSMTKPADLAPQGGIVERLMLKNNKIGIDGWRHICLFIYMSRSIKGLDLSGLQFPAAVESPKSPHGHFDFHIHAHNASTPLDMASLLSKCLANRLAGPELELLNLTNTGLSSGQLECIMDGMLKSGVTRVGLSHNNLDAAGVQHVANFLRNARCEGLDLGGNNLRDHIETIAGAIDSNDALWALSLANCNLDPASLSKLFPKLLKLPNFKFFDLSHNHALFESEPNAFALLRRYLPKLDSLRRLHLADVALSSEQAITLAEILPEMKSLAHINLLENPDLVRLADARTEDMQEEACALYASLLAAARVSNTLVKIDIDDPSAESGELLKALADRVVAYTMRNLQGVPDIRDSTDDSTYKVGVYPDVLRHILGHDEDNPTTGEDDSEMAPDEDYVIGGTGVAKALACVLKNRGKDSGRQSSDLIRDVEDEAETLESQLPPVKAKDMSKHLLGTARKIRARLQPALAAAKVAAKDDLSKYHRLVFLDNTIEGIIARFEDEFPDTRQPNDLNGTILDPHPIESVTPTDSLEVEPCALSDTEDVETELRSPARSRSNSIISHTSKAFSEEEGRALRAGHQFRRSFISQKQFNILNSNEAIGQDPQHVQLVTDVMEDLMEDYEDVKKRVMEIGIVKAFEEDKDNIWKLLRDRDPQHWDMFLESQEKARANIKVDPNAVKIDLTQESAIVDEEAVID